MAQETHESAAGIAGRTLAAIIFGVMVTAAIIIGVLFLTMQDEGDEDSDPGGNVEQTGSRIGEVRSDPEQFLDQDVTLVGEVGEIMNERVFVLEGADAETDRILVASTTPFTAEAGAEADDQLAPDNQIQVIGTIGILDDANRAALGPHFEFLLDDPAFADYRGEPVLLSNLDNIDLQEEPEQGG